MVVLHLSIKTNKFDKIRDGKIKCFYLHFESLVPSTEPLNRFFEISLSGLFLIVFKLFFDILTFALIRRIFFDGHLVESIFW